MVNVLKFHTLFSLFLNYSAGIPKLLARISDREGPGLTALEAV